MEKETKAPLSAEQYIIDNWGVAWALKSKEWYTPDVIEALEDYSTQQTASLSKELETEQWACARITAERDRLVKEMEEKQAEVEQLKTSIERINGVVKWQQEYCLDYVHAFKIGKQQYQELKAKADALMWACRSIGADGEPSVLKAINSYESLNESK